MSIRAFRRLPREERLAIISGVRDPFAKEILTLAFGGRKVSWAKVAMAIGGDNSPDSVRMAATRELAKY